MSQAYLLPCSCGQKVRVASAQAGGQAMCVCGQGLTVPTLRGLRELEIAPAEPVAGKPLRWSRVHGAVFSAGLLIALAGGAVVTYHLWTYAQLRGSGLTVDRSAEILRDDGTWIDTLSATDMLSEWSEIVQEGLGRPQAPYWIRAKDQIALHVWWMQFGGGMIAAGLVMAIATLFIGRR